MRFFLKGIVKSKKEYFMKKVLPALFIILFGVLIIQLSSQEFTYIGAKKCKICHKTEKQGKQFPLWEASKHAQSVASLSSPEAAVKAQEMGVENPQESPKCLKCHAPLYEKAPEFKAEGVTCEWCHGPGNVYKKLKIMKSREESVASGMTVKDSPELRKEFCGSCHEDAHGAAFDSEANWAKILHPVPEKE